MTSPSPRKLIVLFFFSLIIIVRHTTPLDFCQNCAPSSRRRISTESSIYRERIKRLKNADSCEHRNVSRKNSSRKAVVSCARLNLYSSVLNAASVLCVCNFSLRMKKHSSREASFFFDYIFLVFCVSFEKNETSSCLIFLGTLCCTK